MRIQRNFFIFFIISATTYFLFSQYLTFQYTTKEFTQDSYEQSKRYLKIIQESLDGNIDALPSKIKQISTNEAFLLYQKASKIDLGNKTREIPIEVVKSLNMNETMQTVSISDESYLLGLYPLYDSDENLMAYVGILHNVRLLYERFWKQLGVNLLLFFAFFLGTFYLMNRHLKRSVSQINEMRQLSQQYESLEHQLNEKTLEIQNAYQSLKSVHFQDSLTKLPNRFALLRDLSTFDSGTFVIFDIAKFNVVNDTYGVEIGNQLLVAFSEFMIAMSKEKNITLYRVGSDEFVCITSDRMMEFQKWFSSVFERIEKEVFTFSEGSIEISVQLHAGISEISKHCIENGTLALGYAKKHQLEYFIYTESLQSLQRAKEDTEMINVIKTAILNDQVVPYFQAIIDKDGSIKKYEALMRIDTGKEILTPNEFLNIAQRSKYYHSLTRIMVQKSLAFFRNRDEAISINLNMIDIKNTTTVMLILDELKKFPDASRVTFELVESESIESMNEVLNFIKAIKTHGAKIAIDDFGTGYSNFSYLMQMNPDFIKIDGSLVGTIDHDNQAYMVVKSIVEFTHALGIESIGEYIHNKAIFQKAKDLGIDSFQGNDFHFPHPNLLEEEK